MLHAVEHGEFSHGRPVTPEFVSMDDLGNLVFAEQPSKEGAGSLRVPMRLEQEVEHYAVLVYRAPQPVFDPSHRHAHLVEMLSRAPSGFPVTQFLREQGSEWDVPLPQSFVTDLLGRARIAALGRLAG